MATDAQRSYIFDLVGDGITVRGTLVPGGEKLGRIIDRLSVTQASAMIDELKSLRPRTPHRIHLRHPLPLPLLRRHLGRHQGLRHVRHHRLRLRPPLP